ncbi:MAG: sulfatase [Verrucomicrobiota bacterium]
MKNSPGQKGRVMSPSMACVLFAVALLLSPSGAAEKTGGENGALNVILIVVDDLGWMDLGCQGSDYYRTPHIDSLAAEGVRFTDAYSACAVCSPTRASILTGKYPARLLFTQWLPAGRWNPEKHAMREGRFLRQLPLEEITLAEALRPSHATLHVGKWHLGGRPFSLPEQHGFDMNVGGSEHGAPGDYFFPYEGTWLIPTTEKEVLKVTLPDGEEGEYLTDRLTREAIALIEEKRDRPFFLHLPFYSVHTPLQARKEKIQFYETIPKNKQQGKPTYAAMVETVDDSVGAILDSLKGAGLRESTYLIFTSDNGGFARATDNSPLRANKGSHYEGGIRVPMIVSGPGIRSGVVSNEPVITNDLYPTILEFVGHPAIPLQHLDGISLAGHLEDGRELRRDSLYWHYPHYNRHPSSAPVSMVRRGNWKLIEFLEDGELELYNLENDIGETRNLIEEKPDLAADLKDELSQWKEDVGADPMLPNPRFTP